MGFCVNQINFFRQQIVIHLFMYITCNTSHYNSGNLTCSQRQFEQKIIYAVHIKACYTPAKDSGDLFACGKHSAEELFESGETINQYCFYGRCLGFQYAPILEHIGT